MEKTISEDSKASVGSVAPDQLYRPEVDTSGVDERKLMRKIDLRIIPWLAFVYLLNFLDRGSIGNARYRAKYKPWYRLGHGVVLAYIAIGFACTVLFGVLLKRENDRRDRGERDEVIEGIDNKKANPKNGTYESVQAAQVDKGDEWSGFRYTL
ncbi:hypothetical protein H0H81_008349 [Sphagnurus paluster]|uniref:Uncharacterized protein n=1 Tax=Sphagnurus paluster TaxID=117069 RepID=A0A9P7FQK4_9AGAR|nr:hypothetical protein H0H81_008349 [Sphagnurus paluster]